MAFNLNDYEMVKDRIPLFYEKYSDGRITCDIITENADWVTMKAFLWKDMESQVANAPLSTGIAREIPGGFIDKYYENCETSAIGRALANLNMFDGNRPSREEMESAQSMQEARAMKQTAPVQQQPSAGGNMTKSAQILDRQMGEAKSVKKMMDKCPIHGCEWFQTKSGYAHPVCANGCNHEADERGYINHDRDNPLKNDKGFGIWCPSPNSPLTEQKFFFAHSDVLGWDAAYVETILKAPVEQIQSLHDLPESEYSAVWGTLLLNAKESSDSNIWEQE
jgi:hypothetical protein